MAHVTWHTKNSFWVPVGGVHPLDIPLPGYILPLPSQVYAYSEIRAIVLIFKVDCESLLWHLIISWFN